MKTIPLTIRVSPDTVADIDAFAAQTFPRPCPKCQGEGSLASTGQACPNCGGTGTVGMRAEALRYLVHLALGEKFSPDARAMILVYENMFPVLARKTSRILDEASMELKAAIHEVILGPGTEPPPTPKIPKGRRKKRKKS